MPLAPKKPCVVCGALSKKGRCAAHSYDHYRGTATQRGYDVPHWRRFRRWYLSQPENVLCRYCKARGLTVRATDVDHIVPVTGPDDERFFDEDAVQPLCHSCHSKKTQRERKG